MRDRNTKRRSAIEVMAKLVGLVRPLIPFMCLAVFLGVAGFLAAISITILAGSGIIHLILSGIGADASSASGFAAMDIDKLIAVLLIVAVSRGFLHYGEQYCNHFIAFKLLAIIRHKVFAKLRQLCPAKLEGRDKGDLISLITSDIELLEVFYAHTLSPVMIAALVALIMVIFIAMQTFEGGVLAILAYITVGVFIPLWNGKRGSLTGMEYRAGLGELNSFVLESLYGLDETIQYGQGEKRKKEIREKSDSLGFMQKRLSLMEGSQKAVTNLAILGFSMLMLLLTMIQLGEGSIGYDRMLTAVIAMTGSFGPVVALSNLSNNLNITLACGDRVLSLLEEEPVAEDIKGESPESFEGAEVINADFAYEDEKILKNCSMKFDKGKIIGIHGASGSGKSTLLKLIMRFWDTDSGRIEISGRQIRDIDTMWLRDTEAYVTQDTWIFHDTVANNIALGKSGTDIEEIKEAAVKASIHDFIESLPRGYDTQIGELGDTLSGGERQRIGIARAFLHKAPLMLLDEPSSNLDSINEGIILKSLKEASENKTIILVSHRKSTMGIADKVYEMENGRVS